VRRVPVSRMAQTVKQQLDIKTIA